MSFSSIVLYIKKLFVPKKAAKIWRCPQRRHQNGISHYGSCFELSTVSSTSWGGSGTVL